ncbi:hypothetical protein NW807_01875 [Synechococcus sp. R70.1]|uniref:hypothetical protein n=1 Tax=Synechococcus sp. R70.1 TaxID=2964531 RepID=UPI0039C18EBE
MAWPAASCQDPLFLRQILAAMGRPEVVEEVALFDRDQCLVQLVLDRRGLRGSLPPEIGQFRRLRALSLSYNQLSGPIPAELGQLRELEQLFLDYNQFSGPIPPELGQLGKLRGLFLDHNQLSGSIPPELGRLSRLENLCLQDNQLSGSIPSQLGQLSSLKGLFFGSQPAFWAHSAPTGATAQPGKSVPVGQSPQRTHTPRASPA